MHCMAKRLLHSIRSHASSADAHDRCILHKTFKFVLQRAHQVKLESGESAGTDSSVESPSIMVKIIPLCISFETMHSTHWFHAVKKYHANLSWGTSIL